jgi:hypothetical protein
MRLTIIRIALGIVAAFGITYLIAFLAVITALS